LWAEEGDGKVDQELVTLLEELRCSTETMHLAGFVLTTVRNKE
jgi:hypothetical protein